MHPDTINPEEFSREQMERIAFSTTRGHRPRWIEISIWYCHEPLMGPKRWFVQIAGVSTVQGERTRYTKLAAGTLERACKIIDARNAVGAQVIERAMQWADDHRVLIENDKGGQMVWGSDEEALFWLYGRSPARDALDHGGICLGGPGAAASVLLRSILPFVDREAFRRAHGAESARG